MFFQIRILHVSFERRLPDSAHKHADSLAHLKSEEPMATLGKVYAVADSGNLPARRIHEETFESLCKRLISFGKLRKGERIILTVYGNNGRRRRKQERTAQVVIESDGKQQVVLITQGNEYALFEKPLYEVPDTGGIVDLDFVTNIEKGKLLMSYYQLDWIEMPEKKSESRQEEEWSGKVKTITVLPNHSPVERRAPFILGIYDDSKRFLGLDTTWIRQLPGTDLE